MSGSLGRKKGEGNEQKRVEQRAAKTKRASEIVENETKISTSQGPSFQETLAANETYTME